MNYHHVIWEQYKTIPPYTPLNIVYLFTVGTFSPSVTAAIPLKVHFRIVHSSSMVSIGTTQAVNTKAEIESSNLLSRLIASSEIFETV